MGLRLLYICVRGGVFIFPLIFACAIFLFAEFCHAVPAAPIEFEHMQADGTTFKAKQWGDENQHGWTTLDRHTIIYDKATGFWKYAEQGPDGSLRATASVVGKHIPPKGTKMARPAPGGVRKAVSPKKSRLTHSITANGIATVPGLVVPPTGTGMLPVILIMYTDAANTYSRTSFQNLLFGTGNNSLSDYYTEVSGGVFTVSGSVQGWYTSDNNKSYYAPDTRWAVLAKEAVTKAASSINWALYDLDGDCYVDAIAIVHQGSGQEETGNTNDIWSHSWNFEDAGIGVYTTSVACPSGGYIKVNDYIMMPEISYGSMATMGVYAHEYGHSLGLPDLYDRDYSSEGAGDWSLMAGGSWNYVTYPGDRPAHLDPWSKYWLGWITPEVITGTSERTMAPRTIYQLLSGTATSGEYFLVENRPNTGFDAGLPSSGMLIWHIDTAKAHNDSECVITASGSCSATHYKVSLIQADNLYNLERNVNRGDSGDPFPGSTHNSYWTLLSSPSSSLYSSSIPGGAQITNIRQSGTGANSTVSATFSVESRRLTVAVSGDGAVSGSGIACMSNWDFTGCTESYGSDTSVTLTATPSTGGTFTGWGGDCSGTGTCTVLVNGIKRVTAAFSSSTNSYSSTDIPKAIPDDDSSGISSTLTVPAGSCSNVSDVNPSVNITHTWVGDLVVSLRHNNTGLSVILFNGSCTNSDNIIATFDDSAATSVACPPNGTYKPYQSLNAFSGINGAGLWTLTVKDLSYWDTGILNSWSLALGCQSTLTSFSGTPVSGNAPHTVQFTDSSTNSPSSWLWNFGDGGSSTLQNPTYTYKYPGTYTVSMTAAGAGGPFTMTKSGYVTVSTCANLPVKRVSSTYYYASVQLGYNNAAASDTVNMQAFDFVENILFAGTKNILLRGGYNCSYSSTPDWTRIIGKMTIGGAGKVTIDRVLIK